jgi:thiamine-monophosphate kinase
MTLKDLGEFGFIRKISQGCLIRPQQVVRAIGDDAAAFEPLPGELTLVTTDLLVERVHFLRQATTGFDLGYKCLAVNLSDIAAMGGTAREAFISIAIPDSCELDYLEEIYRGIKHLAAKYQVNILGGDTTGSKADLVINFAVIGSVPAAEILRRDTARPGDLIFSTGQLGDSRAGLHLILNQVALDAPEWQLLIQVHSHPEPQLAEGRFLAQQPGVHAAIDVSDGLSSDLAHIVSESGVGARLDAGKIPVSESLKRFCECFKFDPAEFALAGGEDYTLLVTVAAEQADDVARQFSARFQRPLYLLGEITTTGGMELVRPDGRTTPITPSGWNHFGAADG